MILLLSQFVRVIIGQHVLHVCTVSKKAMIYYNILYILYVKQAPAGYIWYYAVANDLFINGDCV